MDLKRREDGFDLSGPNNPRLDHPPVKPVCILILYLQLNFYTYVLFELSDQYFEWNYLTSFNVVTFYRTFYNDIAEASLYLCWSLWSGSQALFCWDGWARYCNQFSPSKQNCIYIFITYFNIREIPYCLNLLFLNNIFIEIEIGITIGTSKRWDARSFVESNVPHKFYSKSKLILILNELFNWLKFFSGSITP